MDLKTKFPQKTLSDGSVQFWDHFIIVTCKQNLLYSCLIIEFFWQKFRFWHSQQCKKIPCLAVYIFLNFVKPINKTSGNQNLILRCISRWMGGTVPPPSASWLKVGSDLLAICTDRAKNLPKKNRTHLVEKYEEEMFWFGGTYGTRFLHLWSGTQLD